MKANEVPEKIYLFENPITATPDDRWLSKRSDENDIEYTRTDAFIEKACKFLANEANILYYENYDGTFVCDTSKLVKNFKTYMKGLVKRKINC